MDLEINAYYVAMKRSLGMESSMNVFKKTFTKAGALAEIERQRYEDFHFMLGSHWPKVAKALAKLPQ